jgi:hypothetical protein
MTLSNTTPPYVLGPDDKCVQVMAYTNNALYWGEVVVKQLVRVSTWLRTNTAPDWICIYNAHSMLTHSNGQAKPARFRELQIATSQVLAFHIVPPGKDPVDYDASEPNRRMQPVNILVSSFQIKGHLRLATQSNVTKFLETARETFTSIYDAQISSPSLSQFGTIAVPFVLVRQEVGVFAQGE